MKVNFNGANDEHIDINFIALLPKLQKVLILDVVAHANEIGMPLKHSLFTVVKLPNTAVIFQVDDAVIFVEQLCHVRGTGFVQ